MNEFLPATIDHNTGKPDPPIPVKINLSSPDYVRKEIAAVYREARSGSLRTEEATKLTFILNILLKAHETCDLQRRLENLTRVIEKRKAP